MTSTNLQVLKRDFLEWSGGFEPDSEHQIVVYVDYARPGNLNRDAVMDALLEWMEGASGEHRLVEGDRA